MNAASSGATSAANEAANFERSRNRKAILRWKDRRHRRAGRRIGDTIAKGSDLLVFNSVVLDPRGWPAILYTLHTPPRAIGELARGARIHNLLLSHISPAVEENQEEY